MRFKIFISLCFATFLIIANLLSDPGDDDNKAIFNSLNVSFGYVLNKNILSFPNFITSGRIVYQELDWSNEVFIVDSGYSYTIINKSLYSRCISESMGDTILILWSGGMYQAYIKAIVFLKGESPLGAMCLIEPLEPISELPSWETEILILKNELADYNNVFIRYSEYKTDDRLLTSIRDSLCGFMVKNNPIKRTPELISSNFYSSIEKNQPDTLFLPIIYSSGSSISSWFGLFMLIKKNDKWQTACIKGPETGSYVFEFECTFDLDGDGILEYFITKSAAAGVYSIKKSKMNPVFVSAYWGY